MVNYKRVVCAAAVVAMMAVVSAAPVEHSCKDRETHYDQRQNGTENYRLNIDGVVIAVAPADSLLSAASSIDFNDLFDLEELSELQKPKPGEDKPPKPQLEPKPQDLKPDSSKPESSKPESGKPEEAPLSDVTLSSNLQSQKKEAPARHHDKPLRLKSRLASLLVPLLRRTRHH